MTSDRPALLGGTPLFPEGLPLVRPSLPDPPGLARRLQEVLDSGLLTNGARVRELEARAAQVLEVSNVVAVASCTAGLMLVYQALGIRGRVVMPSMTFSASAHAVVWAGGTPAFADVDPRRITLDVDDAARLVDGAAAISATHVYGAPADVERLQQLADDAGVPIVYDAAHAMGTLRRGRAVGAYGTASVFSLSPTKLVVAGEGGLVATSDDSLAEQIRIGRDYGNPGDYDCLFPGLNARMSELHATVALASLAELEANVQRRHELVARLRADLPGVPGVGFQHVDAEDRSSFKDVTLLLSPAELGLTSGQLQASLKAEGIDSRRYYHPPIHRQQAYAHLASARELPVTDSLADRLLSTPLHSHLAEDQMSKVAAAIERLHRHAGAVVAALPDSP